MRQRRKRRTHRNASPHATANQHVTHSTDRTASSTDRLSRHCRHGYTNTRQSNRPPNQPTNTPPPVAEWQISFRDNLAAADQLVLTMRGVASPPDGSVYEGWLIADNGVTEVSTGVFEVGADGSMDYAWTSPTGENLIATYASFAVTLEPVDDSDPGPSSQVTFRGATDPDMLAAARRVFAANNGEPATPRNVSYGQGLLTQSRVARDHVLNAFNAAAIGAFGEMRIHYEHIINIIEGTTGARFADYNGDGRAENPGDGFGALTYARQMATLLPAASDDLSAVEEILIAVQDKAQEILAAPDIAAAQPALDEFKNSYWRTPGPITCAAPFSPSLSRTTTAAGRSLLSQEFAPKNHFDNSPFLT